MGRQQILVGFRTRRAVQRLHAKTIAHRGSQPGKFLLMPDGSLRLSDLGTARLIDSKTPALAGTYTGPPGDRRDRLRSRDVGVPTRRGPCCCLQRRHLFPRFDPFRDVLGDHTGVEAFHSYVLGRHLPVDAGDKGGEEALNVRSSCVKHRDARPLPSVAAFGASVPLCVRDRIDELYRGLAAIDYRRRLSDFSRIFDKISTCLLILRNEAKYRRWLEDKARRRDAVRRRAIGESL